MAFQLRENMYLFVVTKDIRVLSKEMFVNASVTAELQIGYWGPPKLPPVVYLMLFSASFSLLESNVWSNDYHIFFLCCMWLHFSEEIKD